MKKMRYTGYFIPKEEYADNRYHFRQFLDSHDIRIKEEANKRLEFFNRFPPDTEHQRLIAHDVNVYLMKDPKWETRGKKEIFLVPKPRSSLSLENILSIDFGEEILKRCGKMFYEIGTTVLDFEDDTYAIMKFVRKDNGSYHQKIESNKHLFIDFDFSTYKEELIFSYSFDIMKDSFSADKPKEIHVIKYVEIDGKRIKEDKEIIRPAFTKNTRKLKRLIHSKT